MNSNAEKPAETPQETLTRLHDYLDQKRLPHLTPIGVGSADPDLYGEWEVVTQRIQGQEFPAENTIYNFTASQLIVDAPTGREEFQYQTDPRTTPRRYDFLRTDIPHALPGEGIYSLTSNILLLCLSLPSTPRPTSLTAEQGEPQMLLTLKRANERVYF